jgi:hypothetical protein
LRSAQIDAPAALTPGERIRRPTMAQESNQRAVGKQETVHAPSPSVK